MGCSTSITERVRIDYPALTQLTPEQKLLVRKTWKIMVESKTILGKDTFLRLFELKPELQYMFPEFRNAGSDELKRAKALFGHGKLVLQCLENAVSSLDDSESFVSYLIELGRRHQGRPLKAIYLKVMHEALMYSFEEHLQLDWTPETAEAWSKLLNFVWDAMIKGLNDTNS